MKQSRIILSILIAVLLFLVIVYLAVFGRALKQKENHLGIALALPKVVFVDDVVQIDQATYLAKNSAAFIKEMEQQGFEFKDQMGSGYVFEKSGERYVSSSRMYSKCFMLFNSLSK